MVQCSGKEPLEEDGLCQRAGRWNEESAPLENVDIVEVVDPPHADRPHPGEAGSNDDHAALEDMETMDLEIVETTSLMQSGLEFNWLRLFQLELEKLQKSQVRLGSHVAQLRTRLQERHDTFNDIESWNAVQAVLVAVDSEEGEEAACDRVDAWCELWSRRLCELLALPDPSTVCVDTPEHDVEMTRSKVVKEMVKERRLLLAARKAQIEDDQARRDALEVVDGASSKRHEPRGKRPRDERAANATSTSSEGTHISIVVPAGTAVTVQRTELEGGRNRVSILLDRMAGPSE